MNGSNRASLKRRRDDLASRVRRIPVFGLIVGLGASACSTDEPVSPAPPPTLAKLAEEGAAVSIDVAGGLSLSRGGTVLLRVPPEGLALGRVGQVRDDLSYDPYPLLSPSVLYRAPDDLVFLTPRFAEVLRADATSLRVRLSYPDRSATLDVVAGAEGRFDLRLVPDGDGIAFFRLGAIVDPKEGLYGLGESYDHVNQRGQLRAMQLEIESHTESPDNEAHVPIPLLIGTTGWGLFVDTAHAGVFDVATHDPAKVEATFGTGVDSSAGLSFHLFAAEHPLDLTRHYYALTGEPRLPGRFALGPVVWRDENVDEAQVEGDLEAMRDLDLAASGIWIDRPYATGVNTFDFESARFPTPSKMMQHAHDLGFEVALWHVPYLDEKDPSTAALHAAAESLGLFPPEHGIALNHWGVPLDFTNPDAVEFWRAQLAAYTGLGVVGFKLDYGEDVVPGATEARNVWRFADGSDERTMHARYQLFYHSTYAALLPDDGGFLLCRHATVGDQVHGPILWPGDLDATFARVGDPATDGGDPYVSVGGFPASIVAGLSLGPSGFAFYGADTGGYRHAPPDDELLVRWFEQTSLSTVMQVGNGGSTVPWESADPRVVELYRRYARLHLRLFPYEWTLAERLLSDGRPIARPLGLAFPEIGVHPDDEYMFGDDLLVAPVVDRGATSRAVVFPSGAWIDWWTGERVEGGASMEVDAPLEKLPLYLRSGAMVPLLRPTIDTMTPTTEPERVDSFATKAGVLHVRVAPAREPSRFDVYDGTRLRMVDDVSAIALSSTSGAEFREGVVFEIPGFGGRPAEVTVDGTPVPEIADPGALDAAASGFARTDEAGGTVWVRVPAGDRAVRVTR
jgi:alpha-D-xyloside xylohydrolase